MDTIATQLTTITVTIRTCIVADSLMVAVATAVVEVVTEEVGVVILTDPTATASVEDLVEATTNSSPTLRTIISKT